ncbi:MAG: TM2 domain-containing protein [Ruminococcus sp.]|nr:TM2 domain-containing protein [Ruminococcus sp.]
MYCKNCGNAVDSNAAVCVNCGTPVGQGVKYCGNCGNEVAPGAAVCMSCGFAVQNKTVAAPGAKSKMAAGLLGIFLGAFGVHNFYLGFKGKALAQLLISVLSCGTLAIASEIWGLIEGIMILTGSINTDADGNPLGD